MFCSSTDIQGCMHGMTDSLRSLILSFELEDRLIKCLRLLVSCGVNRAVLSFMVILNRSSGDLTRLLVERADGTDDEINDKLYLMYVDDDCDTASVKM